MRWVLVLFLGSAMGAGCGSDPCSEYCETSCDKILQCAEVEATDALVNECKDECRDGIDTATAGYSDSDVDDACKEAEDLVKGMSCEDLGL